MPDQKEHKLEYQAQSPDEAALVSAARNFGFVFKSRTPNSISIEVKGRLEVSGKFWKFLQLFAMNFSGVRVAVHHRLQQHEETDVGDSEEEQQNNFIL